MNATRDISNTQDVIDSRDVIARIEYLEAGGFLDVEDREELAALRELQSQAADYAPDWECGETLIRDSYFEDYARELAEDIGAVTGGESWPLTCIDWERAARELRMDYSAVDFAGVTYWIR